MLEREHFQSMERERPKIINTTGHLFLTETKLILTMPKLTWNLAVLQQKKCFVSSEEKESWPGKQRSIY